MRRKQILKSQLARLLKLIDESHNQFFADNPCLETTHNITKLHTSETYRELNIKIKALLDEITVTLDNLNKTTHIQEQII